jgi:hypothetical protein
MSAGEAGVATVIVLGGWAGWGDCDGGGSSGWDCRVLWR